MTQKYDELYHYGVLGMKWGVHRLKKNDESGRSSTKGTTTDDMRSEKLSIKKGSTEPQHHESPRTSARRRENVRLSAQRVGAGFKTGLVGLKTVGISAASKRINDVARPEKAAKRVFIGVSAMQKTGEIINKMSSASKKARNLVDEYGKSAASAASLIKKASLGEKFLKRVPDRIKRLLSKKRKKKG